jgi:hypothetical protein
MKKLLIFCSFIILLFSCNSGEIIEKNMKIDKNGNYYASGKFYLRVDYSYYGLRMETDKIFSGKLENIILYDGKNKKEYILHNTRTLGKFINEIFPENIIIYYYEYCTSGSGVKNEDGVLKKINRILKNNNIKFIYKDENVYARDNDLWDYKLNRIGVCTCLRGGI